MVLTSAALSTELQNLTPTTDSDGAIDAFAQAYGNYMKDAIAGAVPITQAFVDSSGVPAIATALELPSVGTTASASAAIEAALFGFWFNMAAAPAGYFTGGGPSSVPPSLSALNIALKSVMDSNLSGSLSLQQASDAIAAVIHTASLGATVTIATVPIPIT